MKTKIKAKNGRYSLISTADRAGTEEFPLISEGFEKEKGKITRMSSTVEQPYIGINFTSDGNFVGGRTLTEAEYQAILSEAKDNGLEIDYLAWME